MDSTCRKPMGLLHLGLASLLFVIYTCYVIQALTMNQSPLPGGHAQGADSADTPAHQRTMDLSVLVPTMAGRSLIIPQLLMEERRQLMALPDLRWEILVDSDAGQASIGTKRDRMIRAAKGHYVVFLDDDDAIHPRFFATYAPMLASRDWDLAELVGGYYAKGSFVKAVYYSLQFEWGETKEAFLRGPQHLTPTTRELMQLIGFRDIRFGEDADFCRRIVAHAKSRNATHKLREFSVPTRPLLYHYLDDIKATRAEVRWRFTNSSLGLVSLLPRKSRESALTAALASFNGTGPRVWSRHILGLRRGQEEVSGGRDGKS